MMASMGWQGERFTLAASYSRIVSSGGGLSGAFQSNSAGTSVNWKMNRSWSAGVAASYANNNTLTPYFLSSTSGRSVSGTVTGQRTLGNNATLQFGYSWTNQKYQDIVISSIPNINRIFISLSFQFTKPLQR